MESCFDQEKDKGKRRGPSVKKEKGKYFLEKGLC